MLSFVNLPAKILSIIEGNISPREIAAGVCLGAFLGFIPLNGPMALLLAIFFFLFKVNRVAMLFALPAFKTAYLLGMYKLADITGTYILEKAGYLEGFWRWATHLPIVAYLDINNTLVAGGLVIAAVLSIPIYFISKRLVIFLNAKYAQQIKKSALAKFIPGIRLMGLVGDDTGSTLKNVGTHVKLTIKARIAEAIAGKKSRGRSNSILKRIKIFNVTIVIIALLVFHFGFGLLASPIFSSFIVDSINKYSSAKITVEKVNVWPLTLSFSLKGVKAFDAKDQGLRIAKIDDSLISVSPVGLLSKRLVFSHIHMKGAEINLEGTPDGGFDIGSLAPAKKGPAKPASDAGWGSFAQQKDLFGKAYDVIKKRFSKKSKEKIEEERKDAKRVMKTVETLPKGKLVFFKNAKDLYLFEIRDLDISDAYVKVITNGNKLDIANARIRLGRMAYDPASGMSLGLMQLRGNISKDGKPCGKFDILFSKSTARGGENALFKAELNDVDMDAVRFIYENSLPIHVIKGMITLASNTHVEAGVINSRNEIILKGHALEPKMGINPVMGFVPVSAVCDAMNRIDPLKLKFNITGTLERPEFGGFQESLMALIKPYIANFQEKIKSEGLKALERFMKKKE